MADKIISIEQQDGPFQKSFQRVMRMVPDRDKPDKKLQRLLAFRLRIDGEAALSEYLIKKIKTEYVIMYYLKTNKHLTIHLLVRYLKSGKY